MLAPALMPNALWADADREIVIIAIKDNVNFLRCLGYRIISQFSNKYQKREICRVQNKQRLILLDKSLLMAFMIKVVV